LLQAILARLEMCRSVTILEELQESGPMTATGGELLALVATVRRTFAAGSKTGRPLRSLAENGIRWVAANLAIFAEGAICVPLYSRQAPEELAAMIADCEPALLLCGTAALRDALREACHDLPQCKLFDEVFSSSASGAIDPPVVLPHRPR